MKHILKTDPEVFAAVLSGAKTHEIRFNDRSFQLGDELLLKETTVAGEMLKRGYPLEYTGREITKQVTHVLEGYGLMPGWVILSIATPSKAGTAPASIDLLARLEQRILKAHGGQSDGWKYQWNLTEDDSLMYKQAAEQIRKFNAHLSSILNMDDQRARFEKIGRSRDWDLTRFEDGYSDCNVDYAWLAYQAALEDLSADATQLLLG